MSRAARLGLLAALVAGAIGGCTIDERTLNAVPGSVGGQGGGDGGAAGDGVPTTEGGGDDNPSTQGGGVAGEGGQGGAGVSGSSGQAGGEQAGEAGQGGATGGAGQSGTSAGGKAGQGGASAGQAGVSGGSGQAGAGQSGSSGQGGGGSECGQACIDACKAKYPGSDKPIKALYGCIVVSCGDECAPSAPQNACATCQSTKCSEEFNDCEASGPCSSALLCISGASECGICQQQSCKTELSKCGVGSECIALYDCLIDQKCGSDTGCQQQCVGQHPQGLTPLNALSDCIDTKCDTQCPPGQ